MTAALAFQSLDQSEWGVMRDMAVDKPAIGTISTSTRENLGWKLRCRIIWSACPECGREKWVPLKWNGHLCSPCHLRTVARPNTKGCKRPNAGAKQRGALNHAWKGGVKQHMDGYRYVMVTADDPMFPMVKSLTTPTGGYVLEHRLVVARSIGRPLTDEETVHHRNGDKQDNRMENLELWFGNHGKGQRVDDHHCPGCQCFK